MTATLWVENLLAWSLQALALIGVGGALPVLLRLRHPRTLVTYYQLLLLAAVLLPAAQPWRREVIRAAPAAVALGPGPIVSTPRTRPVGSRWQAEDVVLGVLITGAAGNLVWLGLGLLRLRRYRRRSQPWIPSAPAWERAEQLVGVRAEARICSEVSGPVMFGARRPVVLLPAEFPAAPEHDQLAIACHELLHVRRRDWGFTLVEELVGASLWFHPAVWWLRSRIRLTREQAVDLEVVALLRSRDRYVETLLATSGVGKVTDLAPAPLFLAGSQLVERVRALMLEVSFSARRLVSSYALMALLVLAGQGFTISRFPLRAAPQAAAGGASAGEASVSVKVVDPGGPIHFAPMIYPSELAAKRVEGIVELELTLDDSGQVSDGRVVSGPEELRKAALQSALQWHYQRDKVSRQVRAVVEFRYTPPSNEDPNAVATSRARDPLQDTTALAVLEAIRYEGLPAELEQRLREKLDKYVGTSVSNHQIQDIWREATALEGLERTAQRLVGSWRTEGSGRFSLTLKLSDRTTAPIPQPLPLFEPPPTGVPRVRVGGNVMESKLIKKLTSVYPPLALQARIQGTVRLNALIDQNGRIKNLQAASGHPLLVPAAMQAATQYAYQPTLLNGQPAEVVTVLDINFVLSQ